MISRFSLYGVKCRTGNIKINSTVALSGFWPITRPRVDYLYSSTSCINIILMLQLQFLKCESKHIYVALDSTIICTGTPISL